MSLLGEVLLRLEKNLEHSDNLDSQGLAMLLELFHAFNHFLSQTPSLVKEYIPLDSVKRDNPAITHSLWLSMLKNFKWNGSEEFSAWGPWQYQQDLLLQGLLLLQNLVIPHQDQLNLKYERLWTFYQNFTFSVKLQDRDAAEIIHWLDHVISPNGTAKAHNSILLAMGIVEWPSSTLLNNKCLNLFITSLECSDPAYSQEFVLQALWCWQEQLKHCSEINESTWTRLLSALLVASAMPMKGNLWNDLPMLRLRQSRCFELMHTLCQLSKWPYPQAEHFNKIKPLFELVVKILPAWLFDDNDHDFVVSALSTLQELKELCTHGPVMGVRLEKPKVVSAWQLLSTWCDGLVSHNPDDIFFKQNNFHIGKLVSDLACFQKIDQPIDLNLDEKWLSILSDSIGHVIEVLKKLKEHATSEFDMHLTLDDLVSIKSCVDQKRKQICGLAMDEISGSENPGELKPFVD